MNTKQEVLPTLDTMRHSLAHVMAAAVQKLWPDAKFGVGPTTTNGFFYDIELTEPLKQEDLPRIEKQMKKIISSNLPIERVEVGLAEAIDFMTTHGQKFKLELLELLRDKGTTVLLAKETGDERIASETGLSTVTFYKLGNFVDLCRGPHVEKTTGLGAFKLTSLAGAYWRGDEKNPQLQRIYGIAFPSQEDLDQELWRIEEAKRRDHRRLGKDLEIFTFDDEVGPGLPIWLPNGTVIRSELQRLAVQEERRDGYRTVSTPVITKESLYYRSGHLPYYKSDMYAPMSIDGENYYLRPMNCPHHHLIYSSRPRSYRELPLRIAEYGLCHRYEGSGMLSGLMRVRSFTQNDAHIYCSAEQAKDEFIRVMQLHARYYDLFDIKDYYMIFAKPDLSKIGKYVDEPEKWLKAMNIIREAMDESGYRYVERDGDAAFYGPKVDFAIKSVIGTEFAISTNQLDFLAAERFNLRYIGEDGEEHPLYVIHRAPLGSHERFTAFLLEHYAGAMPLWLAPVQIRIIPITDRQISYAQQVYEKLFSAEIETATGGLRVELDLSPERMQKKIRQAQMQKVPYMVILGDDEESNVRLAVRLRNGTDLGAMTVEDLLARVRDEIVTRRNLS